jgi:hypothetical protein
MKSRIIWAAVLVIAIAGFYLTTIKPTRTSSPGFSRKRPPLSQTIPPPEVAQPSLPMPVYTTPTLRPTLPEMPIRTPLPIARRDNGQEVPIQNNATIDFSIGAPVVRSGDKDQEALDRALKDMAEATKETTFQATKQ